MGWKSREDWSLAASWAEAEGSPTPHSAPERSSGRRWPMEGLGKPTRTAWEVGLGTADPGVPQRGPGSLPVPTPCPADPVPLQRQLALLRAARRPAWPGWGRAARPPQGLALPSEKGSVPGVLACPPACNSPTALGADPLITCR